MSRRDVRHRRGTRAFESPAFTSDPTVALLRGLTDTELNEFIRLARLERARRVVQRPQDASGPSGPPASAGSEPPPSRRRLAVAYEVSAEAEEGGASWH
jgi:hypothetical protein